MNDLLLGIWNDLREKRLWPVAALLLAGLIAVPVVLSKPTEEPSVAPAASAPQSETAGVAKGLAALTVAKEDSGEGSTLDVFDSSDPFKPPKDVIANSKESTDTGAPTDTGSADTGGTGGTADTGDTGGTGGTDGGGGTETPTPTETQTVEFRYVADVTFTANGKKRKIKGLERLDVLPSEKNPLLIFLGAGKNGNNAVFLVDSTLTAAGEGKCKPSRAQCAFLYIGAGSVEEITNDEGDSYTLRVDQIRKVKVGDDASPSKAEGSKTKASAAVGSEPASRRFVPPLIADLVSVSGGSDELSDDGQIGR
jgi:hypothetical protein